MNFYRDKQIKGFSIFLFIFALLFLGMGIVFGMSQINDAKALLLAHDEAVASSLLDRGVSRDVVAAALTNTEVNEAGQNLLAAVGIGKQADNRLLPFIHQFQMSTLYALIIGITLLCSILAVGTQKKTVI